LVGVAGIATTVEPAPTTEEAVARARGNEVAALAADEDVERLTGRHRNRCVGRAAIPSVARVAASGAPSGTEGNDVHLAHPGWNDEVLTPSPVQRGIGEHHVTAGRASKGAQAQSEQRD
jgi:hypothetical protein